jgi:hypothetical protein
MNSTTITTECKPKRRRVKVSPEYLLRQKELSAKEVLRLCIYQRLQAEGRYVSKVKLPELTEFLELVKAGKYVFNTEDVPFVARAYHLCNWLEEQYILCSKHYESVISAIKAQCLTIELEIADLCKNNGSVDLSGMDSEDGYRQQQIRLYQSISYIASFNYIVNLIQKEVRIDEIGTYVIPFEKPFIEAMETVNSEVEQWKNYVKTFTAKPPKKY